MSLWDKGYANIGYSYAQMATHQPHSVTLCCLSVQLQEFEFVKAYVLDLLPDYINRQAIEITLGDESVVYILGLFFCLYM